MKASLSPEDELYILHRLEQCSYVAGESEKIGAVKHDDLACDDPDCNSTEYGILTRKGRTRLLQHRASAALQNCIGRVKKYSIDVLYGLNLYKE